MKIIENTVNLIVFSGMVFLTLLVGFIPLFIVGIYDLPDWDFLARIVGCLIAIPMLRLTLFVIDWVADLKYWRQ